MKYLLYFILIISLSAFTFADGNDDPLTGGLPNPESLLDSPVPVTEEPPGDPILNTVFGIQLHQDVQLFDSNIPDSFNVFSTLGLSGINVANILGILQSLNTDDLTYGPWGHFYADYGDSAEQSKINSFQSEINSFLGGFPQASELLTMHLNQGDSSFLSSDGESLSATPESYYDESHSFSTTQLTLHAGRYVTLSDTMDPYAESMPDEATNLMTITMGSNKYEISAFHSTTPIVLDMDDDQKLEASSGQWLPHNLQEGSKLVEFDLNGDGFDELIEWVGPNDGILVRYNGGVMNGLNMFGSPGGFTNGYEKLSAFDNNNDQKLSGAELDGLSIWQDKNGNTKVDAGEVRSLQELGITELGTQHKYMMSYFVQKGKKKLMWDWFPVNQMVKKVRK